MNREEMIQELKRIAPIVTRVTGTDDMGFEFSAVIPDGVIYLEPGMLLNYSGGEWPPNEWEDEGVEESGQPAATIAVRSLPLSRIRPHKIRPAAPPTI